LFPERGLEKLGWHKRGVEEREAHHVKKKREKGRDENKCVGRGIAFKPIQIKKKKLI